MWLKRHGLCASHGGGKRCQHEGCTKSPQAGTAWRTEKAGAASTWAAPLLLKTESTVTRMAEAGACARS